MIETFEKYRTPGQENEHPVDGMIVVIVYGVALSVFVQFLLLFFWLIEKLNGVEVNEEDSKSTEKFDWEEVITAVLEKKGELPIKKLRKKVS